MLSRGSAKTNAEALKKASATTLLFAIGAGALFTWLFLGIFF